MPLIHQYQVTHDGKWTLLVLSERWNPSLWARVLETLDRHSPTAHPSTERFHNLEGHKAEEFYLKIFYCIGVLEKIKDLFRDAKAFRALKQGQALNREGFQVPLVVAAGEEREYCLLKRAFLLTVGIKGQTLPSFLREHFALPVEPEMIRKKRKYLHQLATEIRRLHKRGFVHGDLVPHNILVQSNPEGVSFFFIDNDRTRRFPIWCRHSLWKRNLVQLNRFKLPGISLQDRMRFLRYYRPESKSDRRLVKWLEKRTRRRLTWKDEFRYEVSFRELMKWDSRLPEQSKMN